MFDPIADAALPADVGKMPEAVFSALDELVDLALDFHSNGDETFTECKLCGGWEDHHANCPMPLVLKIAR